ncbi:MAG TPA: glycoside hydrolase family 15 protein [Byssovorax sp.]|jgi:GH15 family glucan-1,4-alpha-glucosidase
MPRRFAGLSSIAALVAGVAFALPARANLPVQRTFFTLPSSNGYGATMLDLSQAKLTHFREHVFASEEIQLDGSGNEVLDATGDPLSIATRDLLYDAYFGLRQGGNQAWLTGAPVDLGASGYAAYASGKNGGTGVVTLVQTSGNLKVTTYAFAPQGLAHAGLVMALHVENTGGTTATGVSLFSIENVHLGYGRPGPMTVIGDNGETVVFDGSMARADLIERGFAGVVVARPLGAPTHHAASSAGAPANQDVFQIVQAGGTTDLPDLNGTAPTADGAVTAFQWDVGALGAGQDAWAGVALAHDGDPFADATVQGWLDAYVNGRDAKTLVDAEIASWKTFQTSLTPPTGLSADEDALVRQSAVMMKMAQNEEDTTYLRELLTMDGEPRYTSFGTAANGPLATLPATVVHDGKGQVLASLPPGQYTIAWTRDMAYSVAAMSSLGMKTEAREALEFTLGAEANRFQTWSELAPYSMPPYQVSLVRYYGFGVEETDIDANGPNLEFDGLGLYLWAAHHYEALTGDTSFVDQSWPVLSTKIADVLVALINPATGLLDPDSSIWETHWNGRQRTWAYSNITAVRGLCDASTLAAREGDAMRATLYKDAANNLRTAIAEHLTDGSRAIASNAEELAEGEGYWDAAVLDAIAMGLFDPHGTIASATFQGIEQHLAVPAGAGWSRNDDSVDHAGGTDQSPWGSDYDSAEWIFTDMRGAVAAQRMGDSARAQALVDWVQKQSLENYLAVSETYDEGTALYKFNAPMIGFGAGAFTLAVANRASALDDPACGAYFDESTLSGSGGGSTAGAGGASTTGAGGASGAGGGAGLSTGASSDTFGPQGAADDGACSCVDGAAPRGSSAPAAAAALLAGLALASRRRARCVKSRG